MTELILWYAVFVFAATFHEAAHAWAALKGGDRTAYLGGQVSLDPMPHIRREPIGMVLIPIITLSFMGWPIGFASAPYDSEWEWKYPKKAGAMALAGPTANFILAFIAGFLLIMGLRMGWWHRPEGLIDLAQIVVSDGSHIVQKLTMLLSMAFVLNLVLGVFNLLPLPPLDGATVIALFIPPQKFRSFLGFVRHPHFGFVGMLIAWMIFPQIFNPILNFALFFIYQVG